MNLLSQAPQVVRNIVTQWLVPLFLLYNIIGWVGLPGREAARSQTRPTPEESDALGKSIWAGWWLGILMSLAGITAGFHFLASCPNDQSITGVEIIVAGAIGISLGVARGFIPRLDIFRHRSALTRRRILAFCVAFAVAVSITCGVFYYNGCHLVQGLIAAVYPVMLIGYAGTLVLEVGK